LGSAAEAKQDLLAESGFQTAYNWLAWLKIHCGRVVAVSDLQVAQNSLKQLEDLINKLQIEAEEGPSIG